MFFRLSKYRKKKFYLPFVGRKKGTKRLNKLIAKDGFGTNGIQSGVLDQIVAWGKPVIKLPVHPFEHRVMWGELSKHEVSGILTKGLPSENRNRDK